ncbi:S8 family peptidase [Candidatus Margulisiibacteriota bacterium]
MKKKILAFFIVTGFLSFLFGCTTMMQNNEEQANNNFVMQIQAANQSSRKIVTIKGKKYVEGEILIKFKANTKLKSKTNAMAKVKADKLQRITSKKNKKLQIEIWKLKNISIEDAIKELKKDPNIEYAEPNRVIKLSNVPNDLSLVGSQWALYHPTNPDRDINAPEAWDIATGNNVVIAVIDTGIDYNHEDLANNIWINTGEIPDNGIDDDNNGYIDDIRGYDFGDMDNDPLDEHYHGTHVSGIIAAEGNNGIGITGVNWKARIMPLKVALLGTDEAYVSSVCEAIIYAADNGAKISNNSYGDDFYSSAIYDAINYAKTQGHLFIAAAGNAALDIDTSPVYPAGYDLANIITVAAVDVTNLLTSFSNYGYNSVDIAAPGMVILSTIPDNSYDYLNGTSQAAPLVAGVAALLLAKKPSLSYREIKTLLLDSVEKLDALAGKIKSEGRLDAHQALLMLGLVYPDNLTIDSNTEKKASYRAEVSITAGAGFAVLPTENIIFSAGQSIDINSNFDVLNGGYFDAVIE